MSSHTVRRAVRFVLALIATLQVVVAVGGPWLDAVFERRSRDVVAHIESSTAATCATLHDHDLCALCRDLGRSKLLAVGAARIVAGPGAVAPPADHRAVILVARFEIPLGSRAPPPA
jgi:hypothetical protein